MFGEEFEEDVSACCVEEDFGGGLRFEGVVSTHFWCGYRWDEGLGGAYGWIRGELRKAGVRILQC